MIRLEKNLGFTGGKNISFNARDKEAKYVVLVNNDCVIEKDSVLLYVEVLEQHSDVGALQGVVLKYGYANKIDSTCFYITDLLTFHGFKHFSEIPRRIIKCSSVEGTFPIYRVEALVKAYNSEKIFEDTLFGFHEDTLTSILIYESGYKVAMIPRPVGKHLRGGTFNKSTSVYLGTRNMLALANVLNFRKGMFHRMLYLRQLLLHSIRSQYASLFIQAYRNSKTLAKVLRKRFAFSASPNKQLIVPVPLRLILPAIVKQRILDDYVKKWIHKNIEYLTLY